MLFRFRPKRPSHWHAGGQQYKTIGACVLGSQHTNAKLHGWSARSGFLQQAHEQRHVYQWFVMCFKMFKLSRFQSPRRFVLSTLLGNVPMLVPFCLFDDVGGWCHRSCRRVAAAVRYVKWPDCYESVNTCRGFFCLANVGRPMEHCERPQMLHVSWAAILGPCSQRISMA